MDGQIATVNHWPKVEPSMTASTAIASSKHGQASKGSGWRWIKVNARGAMIAGTVTLLTIMLLILQNWRVLPVQEPEFTHASFLSPIAIQNNQQATPMILPPTISAVGDLEKYHDEGREKYIKHLPMECMPVYTLPPMTLVIYTASTSCGVRYKNWILRLDDVLSQLSSTVGHPRRSWSLNIHCPKYSAILTEFVEWDDGKPESRCHYPSCSLGHQYTDHIHDDECSYLSIMYAMSCAYVALVMTYLTELLEDCTAVECTPNPWQTMKCIYLTLRHAVGSRCIRPATVKVRERTYPLPSNGWPKKKRIGKNIMKNVCASRIQLTSAGFKFGTMTAVHIMQKKLYLLPNTAVQ